MTSPRRVRSNNHAARDARAPLSTSVMITRKNDVPLHVFYDYWGDIHGVMAARANGVADYWQHRLSAPITDFFPEMNGIDQQPPAGDPIVGLAEITFADLNGRIALIESSAVAQMVIDEQNVLKGTYMYSSAPGNAITLVDRLTSNAPQGAMEGFAVLIFMRKAPDSMTEKFRDVVQQLGKAFAASAGVLKARVHLLDPYDSNGWPTPNVDHERSADQQYQAISSSDSPMPTPRRCSCTLRSALNWSRISARTSRHSRRMKTSRLTHWCTTAEPPKLVCVEFQPSAPCALSGTRRTRNPGACSN